MLSYPQSMYAFLQRKIIASLLLFAVAFGAVYATENRWLEDYELLTKVQLNKFRTTQVSGDIVIVGLDDKSYAENPQWPWPRSDHAKIVDRLNSYGADRVIFDIYFTKPSIKAEDERLASAFANSRIPVFLPALIDNAPDGSLFKIEQLESFVKHTGELDLGFEISGQRHVVSLPYRTEVDGKVYNSIASEISGQTGPIGEWVPIDYAYDWKKVPTFSAIDVLNDKVAPEKLKGKTVLYGYYAKRFGDTFSDPNGRDVPGMAIHAVGANMLATAKPTIIDTSLSAKIALLICLIIIWTLPSKAALFSSVITIMLYLILSVVLADQAIHLTILPSLMIFIICVGYCQIALFKSQIDDGRRMHAESGLPNLQAFLEDRKRSENSAIISINFDGYDLVRRSLSSTQLHALLDQIRTRLSIISNDIYQGTDGSLYFEIETLDEKEIVESLQGLKMFFVNPIALDGHLIALKPAFGYDIESSFTLSERTSHALVASCHAQSTPRKIERFTAILLDEDKQHLSMQSNIKRAMEQGELEVYIQPQVDVETGWTNSGEALIRWNDPLRGVISPGEFMPIMEKTPLIASLTLHILELAIESLAQILPLADNFKISVNVPPSLMTDSEFSDKAIQLIGEADIPPSAIVVEITERGMLFDKQIAQHTMQRFVDAGIEFSIDDFGTANSNIEILRSIPASELKIDQSFIKGLEDSAKDRALVESIINMAHGLEYIVVAEGVENVEILNLLTNLGCDKAQGYYIAKPLKLNDFTGYLIREFLHKRVLNRPNYG
jgi:EAL domain-containing protein (putative c-di-GMP-specific phosphodiesterase class I)/CHASE2 domain-containing sensor protein